VNEEKPKEEPRAEPDRRRKDRRRWATLIHDPERRLDERRARRRDEETPEE
jgi:hypothetical protein